VRVAAGVVVLLAVSSGLGACAVFSGIENYNSGSCGGECDSDAEAADSTVEARDASKAPDAAKGKDAAGSMDAVPQDGTSAPDGEDADAGGEGGLGGDAGDGGDGAPGDAGNEGGVDSGNAGDGGSGGDAGDAGDAGNLDSGLIAFYKFDETTGTNASDSSGNGHTAKMMNGATFAAGQQNNAASMNGNTQYVNLPDGIVDGLTSFSVSTWVYLNSISAWVRVFDFGTGQTRYVFMTADANNVTPNVFRFGITTGGNGMEERVDDPPVLPVGSWQHVAIALGGGTATLYLNGAQVGQNTAMTLSPSSLGTANQNWIGRSQFPVDPFLDGKIDNFRIYGRALSADEVQTLYANHL
jgi:hypothetical protein